ncbi:hypothetical protein Peur_039976 [Populus x canadensis]
MPCFLGRIKSVCYSLIGLLSQAEIKAAEVRRHTDFQSYMALSVCTFQCLLSQKALDLFVTKRLKSGAFQISLLTWFITFEYVSKC